MALTSDLPMRIFRAEVTDVRPLTPGMVRIVFGGSDLAEFASTGVGDEYLRVFFPQDGRTEPIMPIVAGTSWTHPEGVEPAPMRTYTVREFRADRGEVVIDFVVHDGGVAAAWAGKASPGDVVGINTPTGLYDPPAELEHQLLLADSTGIPAVSRILEQTPETVTSKVFLEVPDERHRQPITCPGEIELTWVYGGNGHGRSQLDDILRKLDLPERAGYIWVAGETTVLRSARKYLRHERGLPATAYKTIGYWTDDAERLRQKFERLDQKVRDWILSAWDGDAPEEEREDEYIRRLESLGL